MWVWVWVGMGVDWRATVCSCAHMCCTHACVCAYVYHQTDLPRRMAAIYKRDTPMQLLEIQTGSVGGWEGEWEGDECDGEGDGCEGG